MKTSLEYDDVKALMDACTITRICLENPNPEFIKALRQAEIALQNLKAFL